MLGSPLHSFIMTQSLGSFINYWVKVQAVLVFFIFLFF